MNKPVETDINFEATWDRLARLAPQPDPFCATTHWQLAYREALEPHRPIVVRSCADGLIQFAEYDGPNGKVFVPIERNWLFGCNVLGPAGADLLQRFLSERRTEDGARVVLVSGIDPGGPLASELRSTLSARYGLSPFRKEVQCAASLEGGLDGFLSRRSANLRRNLRRYGSRAAEAGIQFERHHPTTDIQAEAVFARMLAVELKSWKGIDRCGMESPAMTRFYSAMLRRLAGSDDARVMFATRDGEDIGFIFGGMSDGIYRGQQFSFDDEWSAFSIGNLMQVEQVRWLCEEGARRYDLGPLLGPSMEYKYSWTEVHLPIEAWLIHPLG